MQTYPLILIMKATFGSSSTKKDPLALASLLAATRSASAFWYSLKYFSAFSAASFLAAALSFLAYSLLSLSALSNLASLAYFLRMFSGTTLALNYERKSFKRTEKNLPTFSCWCSFFSSWFGLFLLFWCHYCVLLNK